MSVKKPAVEYVVEVKRIGFEVVSRPPWRDWKKFPDGDPRIENEYGYGYEDIPETEEVKQIDRVVLSVRVPSDPTKDIMATMLAPKVTVG